MQKKQFHECTTCRECNAISLPKPSINKKFTELLLLNSYFFHRSRRRLESNRLGNTDGACEQFSQQWVFTFSNDFVSPIEGRNTEINLAAATTVIENKTVGRPQSKNDRAKLRMR